MANENIVISLEVMRKFKRMVSCDKKLGPLDQLVWVAAVASNKEDEVIQTERERSKSQESGQSSSSAIESLRKLNAMKVMCKRWDENDDDHSHLGPELKKENFDCFDSKEEKSEILLGSKDDHDHGDKNTVIFISKKDEDAVATECLTQNDEEEEDWAFEFRNSKRDDKGKGLRTKYYLPPSSHHQDLAKEFTRTKYYLPPSSHHQDLAKEFTRKKDSVFHKKFFNSKDDDHGDLDKKRKMVSFNCEKENSSSIGSRRNYGIQIREPRSRSYEDDGVDDEDWDFKSKKSKNKGKVLMMYREKKRLKCNLPPSTTHQNLPEKFKRKIETMGGDSDKAQLVYQKRLYPSDLARQQNRLSMPVNQLLCNFLEPDEVKRLENKQFMIITIIDPMGEEEAMRFKQWTYKETVKSYVLITRWIDVAKKNKLKPEDLIQVWSFRDHKNHLHLAVVKRNENSDGGGCSSSGSNANTTVGGGEGSSGDHAREDGISHNSGRTM